MNRTRWQKAYSAKHRSINMLLNSVHPGSICMRKDTGRAYAREGEGTVRGDRQTPARAPRPRKRLPNENPTALAASRRTCEHCRAQAAEERGEERVEREGADEADVQALDVREGAGRTKAAQGRQTRRPSGRGASRGRLARPLPAPG